MKMENELDMQPYAYSACNQMTAVLNVRRRQFYKHLTHFRRVLRVCQGYGFARHNVSLPVRERARHCKTVDDVRAVLKGTRTPYDTAAYILKYFGEPEKFTRFTLHEELLLQKLFKYVVYVFLVEKPADDRINFLNYAYTLRALARMIGKPVDMQLPSIRSRSTLKKYAVFEAWLDAVLRACPISMHDVLPSNLYMARPSRRKF